MHIHTYIHIHLCVYKDFLNTPTYISILHINISVSMYMRVCLCQYMYIIYPHLNVLTTVQTARGNAICAKVRAPKNSFPKEDFILCNKY